MSDVLEYIAPAIALIVGVIGTFYSKSGEKEKVSSLTYFFVSLIVVSSLATIVGVKSKQDADKSKSDAIDRERKLSDNLRSALLARSYVDKDEKLKAILVVEMYGHDPTVSLDDALPLYPLVGSWIRGSRIEFKIDELVDFVYEFMPVGPRGEIEVKASSLYNSSEGCILKSKNTDQKLHTSSGNCRSGRFLFNADVDVVRTSALVIDLPQEKFFKMYSRIDQQSRGEGKFGSIEINFKTNGMSYRALPHSGSVNVYLKFFKQYGERKDSCYSSFIVKFESKKKLNDKKILISLGRVDGYEMNLCEIVPI